MSGRRKDAFSEAIVGFFMVAVVALLAYFTVVISGVDIVAGQKTVRARVLFDQVGGLKSHDNVMYRGTKVGKVHSVEVTPSNLVVTVDVDQNVVLRESCRITVCNLSMLGGNYLQLEEGEGEKADLATKVFVGETPSDWMRDVAEIVRNLKAVTEMAEFKTIVTNTSQISIDVRAFAVKANAFADRANALAEKSDAVVEDAKAVIARVQRGEGTLGKLFSTDTTLFSDLTNSVANARAISERLKNGEGTVGRLLMKDEEIYEELKKSVADFRKACQSVDFTETKADAKAVLDKANSMLANLNEVSERLKKGEGTMGKLMSEDGMYNEVEGLLRDCRQIIDNYRDTTPIATFSSLATGAL